MSRRRAKRDELNPDPSQPLMVASEDVDMEPESLDNTETRPRPPTPFHDVDMVDNFTSDPVSSSANQPIRAPVPSPSTSPSSSSTQSAASVTIPSPESQLKPLEPRNTFAEESPYWFWQRILMTTAWLHLHFHTPHRACDLLLKILRSIFICLALVKAEDKVPVTIKTTVKRLGLNEDFEIRAICPQCRRAYPEASPADLMCTHCHIPLFNTPPAPTSTVISLLSSSRPKPPPKPRPVLQSPYLSLSTQIIEFLNRDGNEAACESYLTRTPIPGKMQDIQDGDICQSLKGPDGRKFFETGPDRPDLEELRIGLCFGEDG